MQSENENRELYRPAKCWWLYKGKKTKYWSTGDHTCPLPGTLRRVYKGSLFVKMFLCDKHAKEIKNSGYQVEVYNADRADSIGKVDNRAG